MNALAALALAAALVITVLAPDLPRVDKANPDANIAAAHAIPDARIHHNRRFL